MVLDMTGVIGEYGGPVGDAEFASPVSSSILATGKGGVGKVKKWHIHSEIMKGGAMRECMVSGPAFTDLTHVGAIMLAIRAVIALILLTRATVDHV